MVLTRRCCVPDCACTNRTCICYVFPRNFQLRAIWAELVNIRNIRTRYRVICSHHFEKKYLRGHKRKHLAIPTLFTTKEINTGVPNSPVRLNIDNEDEDHIYYSQNSQKPTITTTDVDCIDSLMVINHDHKYPKRIKLDYLSKSKSLDFVSDPLAIESPETPQDPLLTEKNIDYPSEFRSLDYVSLLTIESPENPLDPSMAETNIDMEEITFEGHLDRYSGVTVDSIEEPCETDQFSGRLKESLQKWELEKKRCVWFKVNIKDAAWVPVLANEGFNFHHARDGFVMMYKWLPETKSNLPPSCHTNLGVGGIVLNERNELLVVTEQHTEIKHWKLPGGYVERGEDLKDAAIREVKEETGIDAEFQSMVTLRHSHNSMFGNSDIYFVVLLRATTESITKSDMEIAACKWMNIDEYLSHPNVIDFNRFIVRQAMDLDRRKLQLDLIKGTIHLANYKRDYTSLIVNDM